MKKITIYIFTTLCACFLIQNSAVFSQTKVQNPELEKLQKPYHPEVDAQKDIDSLVNLAAVENKYIIVQAGGNWCIWCLRFNNYIQQNPAVSKLLKDKFLYYHVNYSKENKNEAFFTKYAPNGPALGFPFFIVLGKDGKVLKVRESGNLEKDSSYDEEKVLAFFNGWIAK